MFYTDLYSTRHTEYVDYSFIDSLDTPRLTLYDPGGGGGFKSTPPPLIFCPHAFNFGATLLCVGDFSQKIV